MNLMVTRAIIINTDPDCSRVKDPNMAPSYNPDPDQIVVCATEIYMSPDAAWTWALTCSLVATGNHMALCCNRTHRCQLRPWLLWVS